MAKTSGDMGPYVQLIQDLKINDASVAPFTLAKLFPAALDESLIPNSKLDFQYLRSITVTGAPVSQSALNKTREFLLRNGAPLNVRVERSLGITEAGGIVSSWRMSNPPCAIDGCQGRLEPNVRAKIMTYQDDDDDSTAREVAPGDRGEIWLMSPCCISAYYKNETATKEAFSADGWYKTGDIGCTQDDILFLFDRKKVCCYSTVASDKKAINDVTGYPQDARQRPTYLHRVHSARTPHNRRCRRRRNFRPTQTVSTCQSIRGPSSRYECFGRRYM